MGEVGEGRWGTRRGKVWGMGVPADTLDKMYDKWRCLPASLLRVFPVGCW